jgi:tricorn protease interacting factor F2/3
MRILNPNKYRIELDINFDKLTFKGEVNIKLDINNLDDKISNLYLDSVNLNILDVEVNKNKVSFTTEKNKLVIPFNNFKEKNNIILIKYTGVITTDLWGIYYSKHNNSSIISTHFEPDGARNMFPCFDEPHYKSIFRVILKSNKDKVFLSNMPISYEKIVDDSKIVLFKNTPLMSTYLLCIVIGDLEKVLETDMITVNETKINGYAPKDLVENMKFSVIKTFEALAFFEEWFDIKYSLPKLDFVSIPEFSSGAMENWGLITYREEKLYCNENTNILEKLEIINTIYHEVAHQWFGNLVTLNNWSCVWLNETFATLFSWIAVIKTYDNEYLLKDSFYINEFKKIIVYDGLDSTHPILLDTTNEEDFKLIFDEISYQKGCCVMNYIIKLMGLENFKLAIREYLNKYKFENVSSQDLFDVLQKYSTKNINKLITDLTTTKGYPIITVSNINDKLILKKNKMNFLKDNQKYEIAFFINFKYIGKDNKIYDEWIELVDETTEIDIQNKENFILNNDAIFPCLIHYENILPDIDLMSNIDKIYFIDTCFILYLNKKIDIKYLFVNIYKIFDTLPTDVNLIDKYFYVYQILFINLNNLFKIFTEQNKIELLSILNEYVNKFYFKKLQTLLFNSNNPSILYRENYINNLLILFTKYLNIKKYIDASNEIFNFLYDKNITTNFDKFYLYNSLFCIAASTNYEKIKNIYLKTNNVNIKNKAMLSLASTTDVTILKRLVDNNDNIDIKEQDYDRFYCELIKNKLISDYAFDNFICFNSPIFKLDELVFIHFLKYLSVILYDKDKIDKLIYFLKNNLNKKELSLKIKQNLDILEWHKNI